MDAPTAFAFVIGMLLLGRALGAARLLPESAPDALNAVVLNVCLPASVLLHAPALSPPWDLLRIAAVPWLLLVASVGLVLALARALRWDGPTTAVLLLAVPLGNTAFLGYPLVSALLGEAAMAPAVVHDQFGTFLVLSTFGLAVVAHYGHGARPTPAQVALRVLRFPPFIALLLALTVAPDAWPAPVEAALRRLADALLPLVTLAIGLVAKLLLLPALALALAAPLGLAGAAREAVVLQAAMPTMITAMALAAGARLAPALGAALVGYGIVLSIALLPLWVWLLR